MSYPRMNVLPALALPILILICALLSRDASAREGERSGRLPGREVRAVWIATVAGLDWPNSTDTAEQKRSLDHLLETLAKARFNTVFFQVRGRGDAMFPSAVEPWATSLTGTPGADPGWDPLRFIIDRAHARGIEVHAWFNTYFVSGRRSAPPATEPPHVVSAHPEWVRRYGNQWWIDPGNPDAQSYLAGLAADLVARYDLDGLHLDYIRYPGVDFDDARSYARYGDGLGRAEWRRRNVTGLLRRLGDTLRELKPWVKLGCTPIGIYMNPDGVRGLESYSDVFQDSYLWVREGLVDYIVPQLYWPLGGADGDPDFGVMATEWRRQTAGRHLYLGVGSYKPEVERQTNSLIGVARSTGAEGMAFFRYENISELLGDTPFASPVLPPPMPWKDSTAPRPPEDVIVVPVGSGIPENSGSDRISEIRWSPPAAAGDAGGPLFTCLYRVRGGGRTPVTGEELVGVYPSGAGIVRDTIPPGIDGEVTYALTILGRSGLESVPVGEGGPAIVAEIDTAGMIISGLLLGTPFAPEGRELLFVPFQISDRSPVTITVTDTSRSELLRATEGEKLPGGHVVSLDISSLGTGLYRCRLHADGRTLERSFTVHE